MHKPNNPPALARKLIRVIFSSLMNFFTYESYINNHQTMTIIQTILVPFQSLSISKMPRLIADDPRGQETLSAAERFQLRPRHRRPHCQWVQVLVQRCFWQFWFGAKLAPNRSSVTSWTKSISNRLSLVMLPFNNMAIVVLLLPGLCIFQWPRSGASPTKEERWATNHHQYIIVKLPTH